MLSSLLRGGVIAVAAGLVAALPDTLGLSSPWPILLVAAVALARPLRPGAIAAVLVGAGAWWLGLALRAGLLPQTTSSLVIAAVVAVAVCTAAAVLSGERLPLWAGLVGIAVYGGLYEPLFADEPTKFMTQSTLALATVVVAVGLGTLTAIAAEMLSSATARSRDGVSATTAGEAL